MIALVLAALLSAGPAREATGAGSDPAFAASGARAGSARTTAGGEDPDAAMLRNLELLEKLDLLENPELFGAEPVGTTR